MSYWIIMFFAVSGITSCTFNLLLLLYSFIKGLTGVELTQNLQYWIFISIALIVGLFFGIWINFNFKG